MHFTYVQNLIWRIFSVKNSMNKKNADQLESFRLNLLHERLERKKSCVFFFFSSQILINYVGSHWQSVDKTSLEQSNIQRIFNMYVWSTVKTNLSEDFQMWKIWKKSKEKCNGNTKGKNHLGYVFFYLKP